MGDQQLALALLGLGKETTPFLRRRGYRFFAEDVLALPQKRQADFGMRVGIGGHKGNIDTVIVKIAPPIGAVCLHVPQLSVQ